MQVAETAPFAYAPASVLMVDGEPVTDGEDVAPLPPCWTADGELLHTADGQLRARRPGATPAGTPAEVIAFSAALDVPQPRYRSKTYDFDSTAAPDAVRAAARVREVRTRAAAFPGQNCSVQQAPRSCQTPHWPVVPGSSPVVHHLARQLWPFQLTWFPPTYTAFGSQVVPVQPPFPPVTVSE